MILLISGTNAQLVTRHICIVEGPNLISPDLKSIAPYPEHAINKHKIIAIIIEEIDENIYLERIQNHSLWWS